MSYFQLTLVWNRVPAGNGKGSINSPMFYALRFSRKNKQTEYILAFALCFLVSIATLWLSSNTKCLLSQQEIDQEETSFGMQLCKNTSVKNKWECLLSFCLSLSAHGNIWLLNGILRLIWTSLITRCCPNELFSAWIQKTHASCYVRGNIMLRHHVTGQISRVLLPTSNAKPYAAQHQFLNIWGVLRSSRVILPDVRLF